MYYRYIFLSFSIVSTLIASLLIAHSLVTYLARKLSPVSLQNMAFKSLIVAQLFFLAALCPSYSAFVIPSAVSRLEPLASSPEDAPKDLERRNDGR